MKDAIVDKHNELRSKVANGQETRGQPKGVGQPKAANMRKLVWNDELAEIAQRWADQCMDKDPTKPDKEKYHDKRRGTDKLYGYGWVGQNWAMRTGKDPS